MMTEIALIMQQHNILSLMYMRKRSGNMIEHTKTLQLDNPIIINSFIGRPTSLLQKNNRTNKHGTSSKMETTPPVKGLPPNFKMQ